MIAGRMNSPAPAEAKVTLAGVTPGEREMTAGEFLRRSSFHLASPRDAQDEAGRWSIWGGGARTSFEGGGAAAVEGDVTAGMLGVDYETGRLLGGVALSRAGGEGDFQKDQAAARRWRRPSRACTPICATRQASGFRCGASSVWGRGEMTLEEKAAEKKAAEKKVETDIELRMGALGLRGEFAKAGGFDLAVKSDVLVTQVDADAKDGLASISADTSRLRVLLEASREVATEGGGTFTPSVEAGLRHDGGDADEGAGVELGGGLRFTNPGLGMTVEIKARGLVTHEEDGMSDWGVGGTIRFAPGEVGPGFHARRAAVRGRDRRRGRAPVERREMPRAWRMRTSGAGPSACARRWATGWMPGAACSRPTRVIRCPRAKAGPGAWAVASGRASG